MDSRLLSGTVEMLILDVLAGGDSYGYQIAHTVLGESDGYFQLKEGSLYPALHRLQRQKLLKAYWVEADMSEGGRRRKYYRLTPKGRAALKSKRDEWARFAAGVSGVLGLRHVVA
jgi:PadR family transcriptional regulator PadR